MYLYKYWCLLSPLTLLLQGSLCADGSAETLSPSLRSQYISFVLHPLTIYHLLYSKRWLGAGHCVVLLGVFLYVGALLFPRTIDGCLSTAQMLALSLGWSPPSPLHQTECCYGRRQREVLLWGLLGGGSGGWRVRSFGFQL